MNIGGRIMTDKEKLVIAIECLKSMRGQVPWSKQMKIFTCYECGGPEAADEALKEMGELSNDSEAVTNERSE